MTTMHTPDIEVIEKIDEQIKVKIPGMYHVIIHNDEKTTFDFVILVLMQIFHKNMEEAMDITKNVHIQGRGIAGGPYTMEIAEEKSTETVAFARANGFPLMTTFEPI